MISLNYKKDLEYALVYPRSYSMEDLNSDAIVITEFSELGYLRNKLKDKKELLQRYKRILEKTNKTSRKYDFIYRHFLKLCDEIPKLRKKISALIIDISDAY